MTDQQLKPKTFCLIAGESSGDLLGARLMQALRKKEDGKAFFVGVGGSRMIAEGLKPLFSYDALSHMGLIEVLRHLPSILKRLRQTISFVKTTKPDALITIDSPDFSFRVAKKLKGEDIPLIHYVAPSVWAWRPGRAKKIAAFLDHLLVLLPFEPPYFEKEKLSCTFVGHPLIESGAAHGDGDRFRRGYEFKDDDLILSVLPGSRFGEMKKLLPVFKNTVEKLYQKHPNLKIVIPAASGKEAFLEKATKNWILKPLIISGDQKKYDAFAASRAALACSGTISIELALAKVPSVIAYKVNPVTAFLLRFVLKMRFATLLNIMQDKMIMPEFLQENCTADKLSVGLENLLTDTPARQQQIDALRPMAELLGEGQFVPSECAADAVLEVINNYKKALHDT